MRSVPMLNLLWERDNVRQLKLPGEQNVYDFMRLVPLARAALTLISKPSPVSYKVDQDNPEKGHKCYCRHNAVF